MGFGFVQRVQPYVLLIQLWEKWTPPIIMPFRKLKALQFTEINIWAGLMIAVDTFRSLLLTRVLWHSGWMLFLFGKRTHWPGPLFYRAVKIQLTEGILLPVLFYGFSSVVAGLIRKPPAPQFKCLSFSIKRVNYLTKLIARVSLFWHNIRAIMRGALTAFELFW